MLIINHAPDGVKIDTLPVHIVAMSAMAPAGTRKITHVAIDVACACGRADCSHQGITLRFSLADAQQLRAAIEIFEADAEAARKPSN